MNMIENRFRAGLHKLMARASDPMLIAILRRRSPHTRLMALRELGLRELGDSSVDLGDFLINPVPGVRRSAAWAQGRSGGKLEGDRLLELARSERVDMVRFSQVLGAVCCGASTEVAWSVLDQAARRTLRGGYGERTMGGFSGFSVENCADLWGLGTETKPGDFLFQRARAREVLGFDPEDRAAILRLAMCGDPRDFELLSGLWAAAGRRMRLVLTAAMGLHGDPRWIPRLVGALKSMDVDPGHGFALRSEVALALGRIGLPSVAPALCLALELEALDHEGRPGAGLGIQRPVRRYLLAALGELQCSADVLSQYLGNTHGSAEGGFYLPAMDALWKVGDSERLRGCLDGPEFVAANALGVLAALEGEGCTPGPPK
jgi:hypothetical protein